jgi:hypothetical protein
VLSTVTIATGRVLSVFSKKPVAVKAAAPPSASAAPPATSRSTRTRCTSACATARRGQWAGHGRAGGEDHAPREPVAPHELGGALKSAPGGFRNHKDDELIMLEALVGREPPFVKGGQYPSNKY